MRYQLQSGVCAAVFLLSIITNLSAQNITEKNWFFGNSQENLVFDKSGRDVVLEDDQSIAFGFGTGGAAVINDQFSGDLLFYSDGLRVYDANHGILPGIFISSLSANTSFNQAVVTCPVPGSLTQYYLFTNSDTAINYTIVDASLPGNLLNPKFPLGDVSGVANNSMGLPNQSEGMAIIEAGDGINYWLLSQNRNTFELNFTSINGTPPFTTRDTTVFSGTLPGFEVNQFGIYVHDTDSVDIVLAPKNANRNVLLINFNPTTGDILFKNTFRNSGGLDEIYDVEWSSDGTKIYYSVLGNTTNAGGVFQIDLSDTLNTDPYLVRDVLRATPFRSYGLRRGIDERIYHLYQETATSPFNLGRIEFANEIAALVVYNNLVFDVDFNGTQFPAFAPPQLDVITVDFDWIDDCQGLVTQFFADVEPEPNNYFWIFGDGTSSNSPAPLKTFGGAGSFDVTLVAELNGRVGFSQRMVNIIAIDSADLGNDTTICQGAGYNLDPGVSGANFQYVWNTGATTPTIAVDADTTRSYWVNITDLNSGCTTYDDIVVTVYLSEPEPPSSQWYFGEKAAIDFSSGSPVAIYDNVMTSPDGCASISDINGDLLFYTNGSTVWNKEHNVMVNGTRIGGDSTAAQSALIIPFANDDTFFYIFTTEKIYGDDSYRLKYSVVDIKKDTARGEVVIKGVNLLGKSTERVTSSGFDSPILLTHEFGNNNFRAYSISSSGISAANHSSIGEPHRKENESNQSGYMKFSPLVSDLSVLIPGDPNYLEIFDYNFINGAITNPRLIDLQEAAPSLAYGLEYSSNGQKLYVSITGANSKILQYSLDSLYTSTAAADIESSKNELGISSGLEYGALQMGPDGVIYLAIDNQADLGSITNASANSALFSETANIALDNGDGRKSRKGLPNFTQSGGTGTQASASVSIACVGQETIFTGSGLDPNQMVETFFWDFGDGSTSGMLTSPDTSHVYTAPISTNAILTITGCSTFPNGDTVLTFTLPVDVFSIPEQPLVPTDTALCGGIVTLEIWTQEDPNLEFYWSTGDTTRTVTFTEPGVVDAAIINRNTGCSSDTIRVFIGDGGNYVDLGEDFILCQRDEGPVLDANNAGPDYVWRRDSLIIGDLRTQQVSTSTAGTFIYSVAVTNEFTGCTAIDSVIVTILPEPDIEQANIVSPDCGEANGSFQIQFNEVGNYSYELTGDNPQGPFTFDGPGIAPAFENLLAGTYILNATNTVTGCRNVEVLLLEDDAPFEMEAISENDCFRSGDIRVILRNFLGSRVDITVTNSDAETVYFEENRSASNIRIQDLDTGIYFVSARQVIEPQCLQTDTVHLIAELKCFRTIAAPNAFSPNGNGMNEEFFVFPSEYIDAFEIFIYNRWGQIVYNSKDSNFRWDGSFQNQPAPPTTYAYKMVFTSTLEPEIGKITQYGSVTLIR